MSAPCQAACSPFATVDDLSEPCASLPNIDRWLAVATDLLFNLSGRQFPGTCADVVRPCSRWESDGLVSSAGLAGLGYGFGGYPGGWRNGWGACRCNRSERCGCGSVPEITLGAFPVVAVDRVLIDGSELDPSFYRVDDFRFLVRLPDADGVNRGWPCCQRVDLASTEPQTWEVQFRYGAMPDNAGVMACAAWACELAKAAAGDDCSLPERARTVASQNVTIDVSRPSDFMVNGDTGVRLVNIWLSSVNPSKLRARARVVDPGTHRRVRRITSPPGG